jgi:long-chain acyl-CoA synthetase
MALLRTIRNQLLLPPRRIAVVDDQRTWKSFELLALSWHLAREIGLATERPRVGVMLPTSGLFPAAALGCWTAGRTVVPLNYLLSPEELAFVVEDAELDAVVTIGPMVDLVGGLPDGVRQLRLDEMRDRFRGLPAPRRLRGVSSRDPAVILYTSGTSGRPKGVMLSEANLEANVRQCRGWAGFTQQDVVLGVLPQFHSFGLTVLTLLPLASGCKAVFTARFIPKRLVDLAVTHRPTAFVAIPSMFNALRQVKSAPANAFASLRYAVSGGEPLPDAVAKGFEERFGVVIDEGYGLTETGPVANWCRPQEHRPHSVGRPLPGVEERIVAEDGRLCAAGEDGEVRIKGPNVMMGYFKRPEETAAVFDEQGFFRSGDMGRFDADGFLSITGRIKEMLIIAGENVFPREIEEVLDGHPSVQASAVIGMPDESRGEVALAFVELVEGAAFDETELRSHCRKSLGQHKVPREIRRLQALPRNPTGKIMRRRLSAETPGV